MIRSGVALTTGGVREKVEIAAEAERLGYESAWLTEVNGQDAITNICAVVAATQKIQVATGIVGIYVRDPLLMAMTVNSMNEFAGGRVTWGLGTSTPVIVERWHGLPWDHPVGRMREYITLVRRLLEGERVKHEGLYRLNGAQLTTPPNGQAPIFLGALNRRMLELAGEIGDGVILNFPTLAYARRAIEEVETGIAKADRQRSDVNITAFLRTTVTDDAAALVPRYRAELLTYVLAPVYRKVFSDDGYGAICDAANAAWAAGDRAAASAAVPDAMVHDHSVIGTAEECARRFAEFRALGIDNAVVFPVPESAETSRESVLRTIRALASA